MTSGFQSDNYPWQPDIDYRQQPERYRVGKGEQGVLICEPYKSEILPFWQFKTPAEAEMSSQHIYAHFLAYMQNNEFVGADLARKYLQMGYTRARRYANYRGGRKYDTTTGLPLERGTGDPIKAESARIFYDCWKRAKAHPGYKAAKVQWKQTYG